MKKFVAIFLALMFIFIAVTLNAQGEYPTTKLKRLKVNQWLSFHDHDSYFWMRGYCVIGDSIWPTIKKDRGLFGYWVRNTYGDTLRRGDVVLWNQTHIAVADTIAWTSDPETLTPDDDLTGETFAVKIFSTTFSLANACSMDVFGIPYDSSAQVTETVIHTATGTMYMSTYNYWTQVDSMVMRGWDLNDSIIVGAYHDIAITAAASADDPLVAGVVWTSIFLDDTWGIVVYEGYMDSVNLDPSTVEMKPGMPLQTIATAKKGAPVAAIVDGCVFARAVTSGNVAGYYPVFLKQE